MTIGAVLQWIGLLQQVITGGSKVWGEVKAVLVDNGIEGDTDALDAVIADAERRKAIAEVEAAGI